MRAAPTVSATHTGGTNTFGSATDKSFFAYYASGTSDSTYHEVTSITLDAEL